MTTSIKGRLLNEGLLGSRVSLGDQLNVYSKLVKATIANSTAHSDSTDEATLDSYTFTGTELAAQDVIEVSAKVVATATNGTDTLAVRLLVGTEEICTTGAVDVANSDVAMIHAKITLRAVGSSGSVSAHGYTSLGASGTVTAKVFAKAAASEDLSGSVSVSIRADWSAASASNSCRLEDFVVIHHRIATLL